jgi:hypothetical protein
MKKQLLIAAAFFMITGCLAQSVNENTRTYEVRSNIPAWPSGILGETPAGADSNYYVPAFKSRFAVVRYLGGDFVVIRFFGKDNRFYEYKNNKMTFLQKKADATQLSQLYFKIKRGDLDSNCIKVFPTGKKSASFTLGLVTMPLKLRLGKNFDFQGSFSLGTTAGAKFRLSEFSPNYINLLFGASISTVSLDSFNTGGRVPGQPLTNIATFSPSLGIVFEFGRSQAGVFYGWDFLSKSTQNKYQWIYNRKPWISIGLGFSIFNIDSKSQNEKNSGVGEPVMDSNN